MRKNLIREYRCSCGNEMVVCFINLLPLDTVECDSCGQRAMIINKQSHQGKENAIS